MKVLVVGGTQFNGRALVRELVRCGHDVTILNRGRTEAKLPVGVKRLTVDRSERQNEYGLNKLLCEDHLLREHRERGFPASIARSPWSSDTSTTKPARCAG